MHDDTLSGAAGRDTLKGGAGDDLIEGGAGNDTIDGGGGADLYLANVLDPFADGEIDLDAFRIGPDRGRITDIHGNTDTYRNFEGVEIAGGYRNDALTGSDGDDILIGSYGADTLIGGAGDDLFAAKDAGSIRVIAPAGATTFEDGKDRYEGGAGRDTVSYEGVLDDLVVTSRDASRATVKSGDTDTDTLRGIEVIIAGSGDDRMTAGRGAMELDGGLGDDTLVSGRGKDTLTGGSGADTFRFESATAAGTSTARADLITDFRSGDRIDLSKLDGNSSASGDQDFVIVAQFADEGREGQITIDYDRRAKLTTLAFDLDGDQAADMYLTLAGNHRDLTIAHDFIV